MSQDNKDGKKMQTAARGGRLWIVLGVLAVLLTAGVYGILALKGNRRAQEPAGEAYAVTPEMAAGAMKRLIVHRVRRDVRGLTFLDKDGREHKLNEWRGRVLLVNFWATWCHPCRKEMPEIGRLQKAFPKEEFLVIAASEDKKGYDWASQGLRVLDGDNLLLLMDKGARALKALGERGLPTTLLVDRRGREIARLIGPAAWNSPEAKRIVRAALSEK